MKKLLLILVVFLSILTLTACSSTTTTVDDDLEEVKETYTEDLEKTEEKIDDSGLYNTVDLASEYDSLLETVKSHLTQDTYHSDEYDLDIPYGIYVPESYSKDNKYPLVMFIPDSTLAGKDVEDILDQGYGGVVWAADEVQTGEPALILYPAYPEVVVDDHNGYSTTDYVPATVGLIEKIEADYSIDTNRIYSTGQSMGAMTSMVLASENPDLFAACMFVDGQWEASALAPLADQTFCYFAAEDDSRAYEGMQEAIPVWTENGADIVEATWDAGWSHDEIQEQAQELIKNDSKTYCIVWETGTITAGSGGGGGPMGGGSVGVHMASFDYGYNVNTMVGWTLFQTKE